MPTESSKSKTDVSKPQRRSRAWWLALPYLVAAAGIPAIVLVARQSRPARPPATVLAPGSGDTGRIAGTGIVESLSEEVRVSPPVPGLVAAVFVEVGETVALGQTLFRLDDRELRAEQIRKRSQFRLIQARLAATRLDVPEKQDTLDRQDRLARSQVTTDEEITRARFARDRAHAQVATGVAELAAAEADLSAIEILLDRLQVKAPRAGQVLQRNLRAGEIAEVNLLRPALVLGSTQRFQVRVDIDEENAARVVPGRAATGRVKGGAEGYNLPLRFVRIEPLLIPKRALSGESTERVDTRVLQVIFEFSPGSARLYPGQQMDVFIDG